MSCWKYICFIMMLLVACARVGTTVKPGSVPPTDPVWKVTRLTFVGNRSFSPSELRNIGLRCAPTLFHHPEFSPYALTRDTSLIDQFYYSHGFFKAHVRATTTVYDSSRHTVRITIRIDENARTWVTAVRLTGVGPGDQAKLLRSAELTVRAALDFSVITKDLQTFSTWLGDRGYLDATATYDLRFSADSLGAEVEYSVQTGPHIRIAEVKTIGLKRVSSRVIRHELHFKKDGVLTRPALRTGINNLYATDLFSFVMVTYDSLAASDTTNDSSRVVRVKVIESKFFNGELSAGYQTYEQFRGRLDVSYNNFFGQGVKGYARLFANTINQGSEAGGTFPWLFKVPLDLSSHISYRHQNEPRIQLGGYFTDLFTSLTYQASPFLRTSLNHRLEKIRLTQTPPILPDSLGRPLTQSIGIEMTRDTRNDIFDPRKGTYLHCGLELSGLGGRSGNQFTKLEGDGRLYRPVKSFASVASGIRAGIALPYGTSSIIPAQERFFLGGASVLRGFADKTAGPAANGVPIGGTLYLAMNVAELRFPIYKWLGGDAFVDAGNLWDVEGSSLADYGAALSHFKLRYNAGCGIRLHFPVIIINVEIGFKLDKEPSESVYAFHLDMGNSF
jgi:outer membrane protein assembly complex protein YaeT